MNDSRTAISHEPAWSPIASFELVAQGASDYVLRIRGELDLSTNAFVARAFRSVPTDAVDLVVDLESVSFIDLSGLHSIIEAVTASGADCCRVRVINADRARRLADLVGLGTVFERTPHAAP